MPLVPELTVRSCRDDLVALWQRTEEEPGTADERRAPPFWAVPWAGGQAVARYVLDHPQTVRGAAVLDLACGSGLVAMAAARAGAASVTAADVDPLALTATALNAAANGAVVLTHRFDVLAADAWDDPLLRRAGVVLAGDVFYDRDFTQAVVPLLRSCATAGALVLAGDPTRRYLPREGMEPLAQYEVAVPVDLEGMAVRRSTVYRVLPDQRS